MRTLAQIPIRQTLQTAIATATRTPFNRSHIDLRASRQPAGTDRSAHTAERSNESDTSSSPSEITFSSDKHNPISAPDRGILRTTHTVRTPGDEYEQEADRIADQVLRKPERECTCGGKCSDCRASHSHRRPPPIQTKRVGENTTAESASPSTLHAALGSSGQPLNQATRSFMESRFGHDFSNVRVHTDAKAAASAEGMGALAYTAGRDIVFGSGQYAPESAQGKQLLAHELTHVLQQGSASFSSIQRREKPGTSGRTAANECYVTYDQEIKVGGKPCWRFNNPGNVGREPSAKADPTGALNHIGGGTDCGAKVGLFVFDDPASGLLEIGSRLTRAVQQQRFVCEFLLSFSHEGQKYLTEISNSCSFLKGKLPSAAKCSEEKGPNLGNLTEEQLECIWEAIADAECSYKGTYAPINAGTIFKCGDSGLPSELAGKLGC